MTVNIHEAKTHFSKLLSRVAKGEEVVIARAGTPVARLVPLAGKPKQRPLGTERGKIWMAPDFDELPQEFLQTFYGGRLPEVEHPPKAPKRVKRRR
jgi:prevent-host-death family protein